MYLLYLALYLFTFITLFINLSNSSKTLKLCLNLSENSLLILIEKKDIPLIISIDYLVAWITQDRLAAWKELKTLLYPSEPSLAEQACLVQKVLNIKRKSCCRFTRVPLKPLADEGFTTVPFKPLTDQGFTTVAFKPLTDQGWRNYLYILTAETLVILITLYKSYFPFKITLFTFYES